MDPEVDEEWPALRLGLLKKGDRSGRVIVHGHLLPGAIEGSVVVITVGTRQGCIGNHVIGEMPLAVMGGHVPGLPKDARQKWRLDIEPVGHGASGVLLDPGDVPVDVVAGREMARHHGRAAGRADAAGHGKAMEIGSLASQPIDVGSLHIGVIVAAQVTPAPIVGKDEEDVWPVGCLRADGKCRQHADPDRDRSTVHQSRASTHHRHHDPQHTISAATVRRKGLRSVPCCRRMMSYRLLSPAGVSATRCTGASPWAWRYDARGRGLLRGPQ